MNMIKKIFSDGFLEFVQAMAGFYLLALTLLGLPMVATTPIRFAPTPHRM